jgi:hypothetical protein
VESAFRKWTLNHALLPGLQRSPLFDEPPALLVRVLDWIPVIDLQ